MGFTCFCACLNEFLKKISNKKKKKKKKEKENFFIITVMMKCITIFPYFLFPFFFSNLSCFYCNFQSSICKARNARQSHKKRNHRKVAQNKEKNVRKTVERY